MMDRKVNTYFFELLQVAIENRDSLSHVPSPEEWEEIYEISKKQTLVGIAFKGVEKLPQEQLPPGRMVRQWYMKADKIKTQNEAINLECAKTCYLLTKMGFQSCIIKGQTNIKNYGLSKSPLKGDLQTPHFEDGQEGGNIGWYRTPGDIDVWVWSKTGKVSDVISFFTAKHKNADPHYHHLDCSITGETETEVHYRPSWMSAPWKNNVAQKFFNLHKSDIERYPVALPNGRKTFFYVPSIEFDAVYQLVHIYRHLFYEGIGLRQILDYYMVLSHLNDKQRTDAFQILNALGMKTFTAATMYVLQEVFAMQDKYLLCSPNEKEGQFLLTEIMLAGNFGHADDRINVTKDHWFRWGIMKLRRNMKFLTSYPEEVICEPFFRVFHWAWRTLRLWRL